MREQDRLRSEHGESKCGAMCTERISGGNVPRYGSQSLWHAPGQILCACGEYLREHNRVVIH